MTMAEKIKDARLKLKISKTELARRLHTTTQAIYKYENGIVTNIPADKLKMLAAELGVTPGYLLGDEPTAAEELAAYGIERPEKKTIPMLGKVACGRPIFAAEEHEHYAASLSTEDADFCLRACGDSMIGARIHDGDIVFIRAQDSVDNGQIAAVIINDEATLKRVYYFPTESKLVLSPENPSFAPLVYVGEELNSIKIIGKAVAFHSRVF